MYIVVGWTKNRYEDGYSVKKEGAEWGDFVASFNGQCEHTRQQAQQLADLLNARELINKLDDPLAAAKERGRQYPEVELWSQVYNIIQRDGNPNDPNASIGGGTNEIIELCRKHFSK